MLKYFSKHRNVLGLVALAAFGALFFFSLASLVAKFIFACAFIGFIAGAATSIFKN